MSRDDDQWIERTVSDPEFADAVWSGKASPEDAPPWYPRVVRILDAAHRRRPPDDADLARSREVWSELSGRQHRRERRQRRRRLLVAGAVAAGVALAAGGAAAAMEGGLAGLPFFGSQPAVDDVHDDAEPTGPGRGVTVPAADAPTSVSRRRPAAALGTPRGRRPGPLPSACQPQATLSPGCSEQRGQAAGGPPDQSPAASSSSSSPSSASSLPAASSSASAASASSGSSAAPSSAACSSPSGADRGAAPPADPPPCATGAVSGEPPQGVRGPDRAPGRDAGPNP